MPSLTATGSSSGPKMISAAAPSSTEPITISTTIDSSMNSQTPCDARQRQHDVADRMRHLLQRQNERQRLRGGDDEQHQPRARRRLHETVRRGLEAEFAEHEAADDDGIDRGKGRDFGGGRKAALEAEEDHEDQPERGDRAAPQARRRESAARSLRPAAGRLPRMMHSTISASAIRPAGSRPATNRPPIDRLATKPRMIRLMQGGMVSAITADAASSATALPGILPGAPRRRDQHRADRGDVGHLGAGDAREQHHRHHHDDVQPAAHPPDRALQQFDQANRHAVGFHQIADQDEERDREQHEIVDAARHLLREDDAGQRALHPDEDQRRERQRKADRQSAEQRDEEADQHQRARRRHRVRATGNPTPDRAPAISGGRDDAGDHVAKRTRCKKARARTPS